MRRKRGEGYLRLIIAYKALIGAFEIALASVLYSHLGATVEETFTAMAVSLNLDIGNHVLKTGIDKANMLGGDLIASITAVIFAFGVFNIIESVGLHYRQRWAEWLTVVATGTLIPFELYEIIKAVSALKVAILVINIAIVYYLAKHTELFGKKALKRASL